jgi:hypothetical protein
LHGIIRLFILLFQLAFLISQLLITYCYCLALDAHTFLRARIGELKAEGWNQSRYSEIPALSSDRKENPHAT